MGRLDGVVRLHLSAQLQTDAAARNLEEAVAVAIADSDVLNRRRLLEQGVSRLCLRTYPGRHRDGRGGGTQEHLPCGRHGYPPLSNFGEAFMRETVDCETIILL